MDEADEFFDCDNDDYGSQVNDALLDSLSAGMAGKMEFTNFGVGDSAMDDYVGFLTPR